MATYTITGLVRVKKWVQKTIGSVCKVYNKSKSLEDKFSFIQAKSSSKVVKESLVFNVSTRKAKLAFSSDQKWDRAMLFNKDVPVISTYMGSGIVPAPTRTVTGLGWKETISSITRVGVPYKQLWWFNSANEIELHPDIWDISAVNNYSLSYNKLTQYISYKLLLGEGESWYLDWQIYNRRTLDQNIKEEIEELIFDEIGFNAELIHFPVKDQNVAILYKHTGVETVIVPVENWSWKDEKEVVFNSRNYLDNESRYSIYYKYYQPIEAPVVEYTVEIAQSTDDGENWTEWELVEREFLVDKTKGVLMRFRLTIDEIDDPDSFRFKAFCARKVCTQF